MAVDAKKTTSAPGVTYNAIINELAVDSPNPPPSSQFPGHSENGKTKSRGEWSNRYERGMAESLFQRYEMTALSRTIDRN